LNLWNISKKDADLLINGLRMDEFMDKKIEATEKARISAELEKEVKANLNDKKAMS
jgi:LEA14-like dessication related protein